MQFDSLPHQVIIESTFLSNKNSLLFCRKLPKTLHVTFGDIRSFRKMVLVTMSVVVTLHVVCQSLNMWYLSETQVPMDKSSVFYMNPQPSFQSLLKSTVFITGFSLLILFLFAVIMTLLENFEFPLILGSTRLRVRADLKKRWTTLSWM